MTVTVIGDVFLNFGLGGSFYVTRLLAGLTMLACLLIPSYIHR